MSKSADNRSLPRSPRLIHLGSIQSRVSGDAQFYYSRVNSFRVQLNAHKWAANPLPTGSSYMELTSPRSSRSQPRCPYTLPTLNPSKASRFKISFETRFVFFHVIGIPLIRCTDLWPHSKYSWLESCVPGKIPQGSLRRVGGMNSCSPHL